MFWGKKMQLIRLSLEYQNRWHVYIHGACSLFLPRTTHGAIDITCIAQHACRYWAGAGSHLCCYDPSKQTTSVHGACSLFLPRTTHGANNITCMAQHVCRYWAGAGSHLCCYDPSPVFIFMITWKSTRLRVRVRWYSSVYMYMNMQFTCTCTCACTNFLRASSLWVNLNSWVVNIVSW